MLSAGVMNVEAVLIKIKLSLKNNLGMNIGIKITTKLCRKPNQTKTAFLWVKREHVYLLLQ